MLLRDVTKVKTLVKIISLLLQNETINLVKCIYIIYQLQMKPTKHFNLKSKKRNIFIMLTTRKLFLKC
jgi:hypothetical protein